MHIPKLMIGIFLVFEVFTVPLAFITVWNDTNHNVPMSLFAAACAAAAGTALFLVTVGVWANYAHSNIIWKQFSREWLLVCGFVTLVNSMKAWQSSQDWRFTAVMFVATFAGFTLFILGCYAVKLAGFGFHRRQLPPQTAVVARTDTVSAAATALPKSISSSDAATATTTATVVTPPVLSDEEKVETAKMLARFHKQQKARTALARLQRRKEWWQFCRESYPKVVDADLETVWQGVEWDRVSQPEEKDAEVQVKKIVRSYFQNKASWHAKAPATVADATTLQTLFKDDSTDEPIHLVGWLRWQLLNDRERNQMSTRPLKACFEDLGFELRPLAPSPTLPKKEDEEREEKQEVKPA